MPIFSDRISSLAPSAIREILKVTQNPDVISFAAGNPSPETFPASRMSEIAANLFSHDHARALQYGISEGYEPLRLLTATRMKEKYNIGTADDEIAIVSGGQQGIELTAKIFANEHDVIACESPSFIGALNAFRSYNLELISIPLDSDGINLDVLEKKLQKGLRVKLFYIIPTFQNPTGIVTSIDKRIRLLELAEKYDFYIIEDSPYFELRYSGDDIPTIKSMDKTGRTIFVGSYSKTIAPGIRIGYVIAHKDIISKLIVAKQVSDVHTNLFFQMLVHEYIISTDYDEHIPRICALYRSKRDLMYECIRLHFPQTIKCELPDGGLFIWCSLPNKIDGTQACRMAAARKVAMVPGESFAVCAGEAASSFRLNFSLPSAEQIESGIELLGMTLKDCMKKSVSNPRFAKTN